MSKGSHIDTSITIELLDAQHVLDDFTCHDDELDSWLHHRALRNQKLSATRTFVACEDGSQKVIGFYGIASSEIVRTESPKSMQRNMPATIPTVTLGRLGIDHQWQGRGLGRRLVSHMIQTVLEVRQKIGTRAIITHPINDRARQFYLAVGFEELNAQHPLLFLDLRKIEQIIQS